MSTWWYYECLDHTPPLRAELEFTQHTEDEHFIRGVAMLSDRPTDIDDSYWRAGITESGSTARYFAFNASKFLVQHPTCRIGLVNEYDERQEVLS